MTESTENSSLPMFLAITGAVVLVAVGGWFYLDHDTAPGAPRGEPASFDALLQDDPARVEAVEDSPAEEAPADAALDDALDVEAELRKARLAAGADILVFPREQSAIYYYERVLAAEPGHEVAAAELESVLAAVALTVSDQLANEAFDDAYAIAAQVARIRPDHLLVTEVQETLDTITEEQVDLAIQAAQAGNDADADQLVAAVAALPGRSPDYLAAVRESIEEIRRVRVAAEQDRAARARLAEDEARTAWVDSVNAAITAGNLAAPAGASAMDLLAEQNRWADEREQLTAALLAALEERVQAHMASAELEDAERLLDAAVALSDDDTRFQAARDELEQAFLDAEAAEIKAVSDLVALNIVAARYPRRAVEKGQSGWVDILFTVAPDGTPVDIDIVEAQPEITFNRAAVAAVEQWRFEPVEFRGRIIPQRVGARLKFELE